MRGKVGIPEPRILSKEQSEAQSTDTITPPKEPLPPGSDSEASAPSPAWEAQMLTRSESPIAQSSHSCSREAPVRLLLISARGPTHRTMGTLGGHLVAALLFLIVALYYSVLVSLALLRDRGCSNALCPRGDKRGHRWWQLVSVEAVVKVVFS